MKGQDSNLIIKRAIDEYDCNLLKLYEDLYNGKKMVFDLCKSKIRFKVDKLLRHVTLENFERKIKF